MWELARSLRQIRHQICENEESEMRNYKKCHNSSFSYLLTILARMLRVIACASAFKTEGRSCDAL